MMFERQRTGGSFVAYEAKASRTPLPILVGDREEKAHIHPEVFIREYPHIKVKSIKPADNGGNGLAVEFDPESVPVAEGSKPLRRPINANTVAGTDIEKALRWAHDNDEPVYLGVEFRRKYRNSSKQVIPYDTPIMTLRGCDADGNATDASQGASRENISKVLAVVGPVSQPDRMLISPEVRSDPLTWPAVRSNRIGATPPLEWVRITRTDGTPGGAAIPKTTWTELTNTGGGSLDEATMNRLADAVAARLSAPAAASSAGLTRPAQQSSRSVEAKRWEPFNSDGRINAGSYAVTALLALRDVALTALGDSNYAEAAAAADEGRTPTLLTAEEITNRATSLAPVLAGVADRIQSSITGRPANRIDGSYVTATKTLRQIVLRDLPLTAATVADPEASKKWLDAVADLGMTVAAAVIASTEGYLETVAEPAPVNDASGRGQRQAARQNPPTESRPATTAANRSVQQPPQPNFSTDATTAPVASVTSRNTATLNDLVQLVDGMTLLHLKPMVAATFGTSDLELIDPDKLTRFANTWKEDPDRFRESARIAYTQATKAAS